MLSAFKGNKVNNAAERLQKICLWLIAEKKFLVKFSFLHGDSAVGGGGGGKQAWDQMHAPLVRLTISQTDFKTSK